jgi:uncharacterized integral membrane protein
MTDRDDVVGDDLVDEAAAEEPETLEPTEAEPTRYDPAPAIPWRIGLFLLLAVLVVIFSVQNTQDVALRFLGWSWELPLVIVILGSVVVSVLLDEILGGIIKRRRRQRYLEREELKRLRGGS